MWVESKAAHEQPKGISQKSEQGQKAARETCCSLGSEMMPLLHIASKVTWKCLFCHAFFRLKYNAHNSGYSQSHVQIYDELTDVEKRN